MPRLSADELEERICSGDRRALARAVTLVESTRADHRIQANELLDRLIVRQRGKPFARRIGISGTPGVGKSTFIEALGLALVDAGRRVAVLAVDPSSARTGGSILGDKTRMEQLTRREEAFIRPSAAGGTLGGVTQRTSDVMALTEAAGYDVVIVETVGVGQSETAVADMTDLFVLLVAPAGGDDLQGIKRGVMELVDLVVINKADGELTTLANHTAADYRHALSLLRPRRGAATSPVLTCSALEATGITDVWSTIDSIWRDTADSGELDALRAEQAVTALDRSLERILLTELINGAEIDDQRQAISDDVAARRRAPSSAAADLAKRILEQRS